MVSSSPWATKFSKPRDYSDGLRPMCTQCIKSARPGDTCEYADGGRTRTQMLEDNIARLELRIRELEEPEDEDAVRLHLPYAASRPPSGLSLSFRGSPFSSPVGMSPPVHCVPSPGTFYFENEQAPTATIILDTPQSSHSPSAESSGQVSTNSAYQEEPSRDIIQHLLQIFLPHAMDVGFFLNVSRFRNSALLELPLGHYSRPCTGLLSTVYLMGVHLSGDPNNQETVYLSRALTHTANMLSSSHPHRILHAIQAEILLAVYFLRTGRILEGKYHLSASVSLTLGAQLHKTRGLPSNTPATVSPLHQFYRGSSLAPPNDSIEEGERINAFWMAYTLSNCWGVAAGTLSSSVFESHSSSIDAPWPLDMEDYEQVMWNALMERSGYGADVDSWIKDMKEMMPSQYRSAMTVKNFLKQVPSPVKDYGTLAMFAKSSILLDKAANVAATFHSEMGSEQKSRFGASFASLDHLIETFQSTLSVIPLNHQSPNSYEFGTHFVTYTLAYVATIQLHSIFISTSSHSRNKALTAARSCITILRQVDMSSVVHINPILGSCWTSICQVLIDELQRVRKLSNSSQAAENWGSSAYNGIGDLSEEEIVRMLEKVFSTMAVFSVDSPVIGYQLAKVQEAFQTM
ncbi:hypothetical protein D9757_004640 [Collybiopsis confluens]|uniref:Xylanolytic transcriptional activator regulatory domain-containing protein n=1 Tax=Collybiopsis confluens TaxID=2823264 RepID=A0A8H5MC68_9AGAR|nr:hypothetical protein D9757_004640 [Collybiopsis confluens]